MVWKSGKVIGALAVVALITVQFVGPERTNPRSDPHASFASAVQPRPEVAATLQRACHDCHSNDTVWPWYSRLAPVSWFVVHDVNEGRARLNFSEWTRPGAEGDKPSMSEVCEEVQAGKMPLRSYLWLHPQARLTSQDITALCTGTAAAR